MELKHVIYLNAPSLTDRNYKMVEYLKAANVPQEKIIRWEGRDGGDYKTRDDLIRAAVSSGYTFFEPLLGTDFEKGLVAINWSVYELLSWVSQLSEDESALVLYDDARLTRPFNEYVSLACNAPPFDIIQLFQWDPMHYWLEHWDVSKERTKLLETSVPMTPCNELPGFYYGTKYPGDQALIYSAEGARKMCHKITKTLTQYIEKLDLLSFSSTWRIFSENKVNSSWVQDMQEPSYHKYLNQEENQ